MQLRSIFKNAGLYAIADIFNKALSFILLPFFTIYFSPIDYGIIDTFTIFQLILGIFINWEINQALVRFVPESTELQKKTFYSTSLVFVTLNIFILAGIFIFFQTYFIHVINKTISLKLYYFGIATVFFNILNSYFLLISRVQLAAKFVLYSTLTNGLLTVLLSCFFVLYLHHGLEGYFLAMLCGSIASTLVLFFGHTHLFSIQSFLYPELKKLLSYSIPLIPSALGVFITIYIDRVIIKNYFNDEALGLFGIAYRFSLISTIIVGSYLSSIGPLIFRDYKLSNFSETLNNYLKVYLFIALILLCGFGLFAKEVILIFTSNASFNTSMNYIYLLALNGILFNFYVFFPSLSIAKNTFIISLITIGSALLNIVLIIFLIPLLDIYGILISTLISTICLQISTYYFGSKKFPIAINKILLIKFGIIASFFGAINYIDLTLLVSELNFLIISIKLLLFIAFSVFLYFQFAKTVQSHG